MSASGSGTWPSTSSSPARSTPTAASGIEFDVEQKPGKPVTAGTRVARKRRLSIFVLLRALGYDEENAPGFLEAFVRHFDFLEDQWEKDRDLAPTQDDALVEIYKRARPGEPPSVDSARNYFRTAFFENRRYDLSRVGRYKLNKKLGPELHKLAELFPMLDLDMPESDQPVLSRCEVLASMTYLLNLVQAEPGYRLDDQDHFANRRIRSVGELIQNQVRIGLSRMERVVRERMTTQDVEAITPQTLINIRPVGGSHQGVLRDLPAVAVHGPGQPLVGPDPSPASSPRWAPAACRASVPASRSATCTSATTAACARSRRPRVRTSA